MKKKVLLIILVVISTILVGCNKIQHKEKYNGQIISFTYSYGSYNGGYYNYNIVVSDKKYIFTAEGYNGVDLNINKEITQSSLEELSKIINDEKIYEWNNFNKKDDNVLDGYSFSLKIEYDDGKIIKANGYMRYPKNYDEKHTKILKFIESIK